MIIADDVSSRKCSRFGHCYGRLEYIWLRDVCIVNLVVGISIWFLPFCSSRLVVRIESRP